MSRPNRADRPNQTQASYQLELMGQRWQCDCGCNQFQSLTTNQPGTYSLCCSRCNTCLGFLDIVQVIRPPP